MGAGLIGFAFFFILLGFALFFDRALLALGNIFLIVGVILLLVCSTMTLTMQMVAFSFVSTQGLGRARTFFVQPDRLTGSACFFAGIALLLLRWPIVGVILEVIGFYKLFGGFFPVIISVVRSIPGFGYVLSLPYISTLIQKLDGTSTSKSTVTKPTVTSNPARSVNIVQD